MGIQAIIHVLCIILKVTFATSTHLYGDFIISSFKTPTSFSTYSLSHFQSYPNLFTLAIVKTILVCLFFDLILISVTSILHFLLSPLRNSDDCGLQFLVQMKR